MTIADSDRESLTDFSADPARFLERLHGSCQPLRLRQDEHREFVVLNADAFDRLISRLQEFEELAAIREGLADLAAGRHRPMREFMAEVAARFDFPASD